LLRDAQVLPIWEGTTNVLSLDTLRAIQKAEALPAWIEDSRRRLAEMKGAEDVAQVADAVKTIEQRIGRIVAAGSQAAQAAARSVAYSIARTEAALLLLEHARATQDPSASVAARRWCARRLARVIDTDDSHRADSRRLID